MRAARAYPGRDPLQLDQIDKPVPGPHDVLVRVRAAGIAPGLFHLLKQGWVPLLPSTLGHEIAGDIAEIGTGASGVAVGDRVRVHPNLTCGQCEYCLSDREQMCTSCSMIGHAVFGPRALPAYRLYHNGGFADYVKVPAANIDPLPGSVSYDVGAKVHDLANAYRALGLARLRPGATLAVAAATGAMGTATVRLAPLFGVTRLIAIARSADRLSAVAKLDPALVDPLPTETLAGDWETTGGLTTALRQKAPDGVDAVLDFLPAGAGSTQTLLALRNGAAFVHMGGNSRPIELPPVAFSVGCWRLIGTRNCSRNDARKVLHLLGSGALGADDLVTHRYPLTAINDAVTGVLSRSQPMWMTVIHP